MLDLGLIQMCAAVVDQHLMTSILTVESGHNPYAIGVINGRLKRQPRNIDEAKATVLFLERAGYNYSLGAAQVNKVNFNRFKLTLDNVFDPCTNLNAGSLIFKECHDKAISHGYQKMAIQKALSCYYTGRLNSRAGAQYANKVITRYNAQIISGITKELVASSNSSTNQSSAVVF